MNVVIVAAGEGRRLRPLTDEQPKCMIELAGQPILHRQIATLVRNGIENITLVAGYRADRIQARNASIVINHSYARCNMVVSLFQAAPAMKSGQDLLVSYGDIVYEDRVLHALMKCPGEIAVAADVSWRTLWQVRMEDPLMDAESFKMTENNRILELGAKLDCHTEAQAQFIGLIKVRKDRVAEFKTAYQEIDRKARFRGRRFAQMHMTDFLQHLINVGWDIRAAPISNGWLEVDSVQDLERYHSLAHAGRLDSFIKLDPPVA
ncbi:MAG: NTP transferase domain-containing protein [Wenzhouxiangella sp.]